MNWGNTGSDPSGFDLSGSDLRIQHMMLESSEGQLADSRMLSGPGCLVVDMSHMSGSGGSLAPAHGGRDLAVGHAAGAVEQVQVHVPPVHAMPVNVIGQAFLLGPQPAPPSLLPPPNSLAERFIGEMTRTVRVCSAPACLLCC
jgi:hypothetical protein